MESLKHSAAHSSSQTHRVYDSACLLKCRTENTETTGSPSYCKHDTTHSFLFTTFCLRLKFKNERRRWRRYPWCLKQPKNFSSHKPIVFMSQSFARLTSAIETAWEINQQILGSTVFQVIPCLGPEFPFASEVEITASSEVKRWSCFSHGRLRKFSILENTDAVPWSVKLWGCS